MRSAVIVALLMQVAFASHISQRQTASAERQKANVKLIAELLGQAEPKKKEEEAAKEQGFMGQKVKHEDMKTVAEDWRREYGPKVAPAQPKKSGSTGSIASAAVLLAAALLQFGQ